MTFTAITFNTESGGRPGFDDYLTQLRDEHRPTIICLQEVHSRFSCSVPEYMMPLDPGKRVYPVRTNLFRTLQKSFGDTWVSNFAAHLVGFHDLEATPNVLYGSATFINQQRCFIHHIVSSAIYRDFNKLNEEASGGLPCGKVATAVLLTPHGSEQNIIVVNVHGFWSRRGKIDMPERFEQNNGIATLVHELRQTPRGKTAEVLVMGDLNYRSDMSALLHLASHHQLWGTGGGVVLNHQFGITRTRTDFYQR
jgi:endonuclease/exonuclease/phosphatase family metal-dependent hydrolase